ncbi:MAG: alcohol dehydrogenase catalytic domain-containing protein [Prevotella sp.]|nr:alcohol dehydrogenase catalytic domain-containing protein [Prevotella sp.]
MRAIKIIDNTIRYLEDANMPALTPLRDVLVKVCYAGICRTDIGVANGTISHQDNIVLGHEFCGTIESFYSGGTEFACWRKGQVVSCNPMMFGEKGFDTMCGKDCDGAFAEYIAVPSSALIVMPDHLLSPLGAYLEPVAAALAPERFLKSFMGNDICVFGDNRIAELALQVAHSMGHKEVRLVKNVLGLDSCKYDCIIETEPQYINEYIDALRPGGTLILKSRAFTPCELIFNSVAMKEITIQGARYGDFYVASHLLAATSSGLDGVLDTERLFGPVFELSEYASAFHEAQKKNSKKIFFRLCAE